MQQKRNELPARHELKYFINPAELEALARRVVSGEIRYCPHGRPVSVKLTKSELDRQFKRIV